jgi:prepilin-type N-terminal cleavage/methylation domain-containing protein
MSTATNHAAAAPRRDHGFTLPEVLIAITLSAVLAAVLSAAITTTLRQAKSTEGRANVARAESAIDTWLPADLASTDVNNTALPAVTTDPAATPCGTCTGIDLNGTNALQLAWESRDDAGAVVVTRVQYQYIEIAGEWKLRRIECIGSNQCTVSNVLHDVASPPDPGFTPGSQRPIWVLNVSDPDVGGGLSGDAVRVAITVNGGGSSGGAGGGVNTINLTAGGRATGEISADAFSSPSFARAKSRCGGPVTLIVDDSGSIGGNVDTVVKPGVWAFIEAFRGTPTQVQVIKFNERANAIGPGDGWHRYVDMTDDAQVNLLVAAVDQLNSEGYTNWEEAFFRTFKESDGSTAAQLPNRIVFFTDGIPTVSRRTPNNFFYAGFDASNGTVVDYNAGVYNAAAGWPVNNGGSFHQESWDRADVILDQHRATDMIFVGVGSGLGRNVSWIHNPAVYSNPLATPAPVQTRKAWETIAHLLANGPSGHVPAILAGGEYTNPETANFYLQSSFDAVAFAKAMKAAALKDCGGTLTIQTRLTDGTPVADEFVYENAAYRDNAGNPVPADPRRVTTSKNFRTGTFDFDIPASTAFFTVDVVPQNLATVTGYTPVGWSCRVGGAVKPVRATIPIAESAYTGISVDVKPNEAVSCILEVSR